MFPGCVYIMTITRRNFINLIAASSFVSFTGLAGDNGRRNMKFSLPDLPYNKNDLDPVITANTLDFHHGKHHRAYVDNLNKLIQDTTLANESLENIIIKSHNDNTKVGIFNNAAQIWNHTFYWHSMKRNGGGQPSGELMKKIQEDFGSFENFVSEFKTAGTTQFGSGWAWLVLDNNKLKVAKTANAMCPLVDKQIPLMTMDVWEHAYYLDYQNRRPDYIASFLNKLVNWSFAEDNFVQAKQN